MFVSVLTMGFWPTYQPVSAILPAEVNILIIIVSFSNIYKI
jgi:hypothetical protein